MSTRAVYSFKDQYDEFHVYVHHDGYPSGAAEKIEAAPKLAWAWPRFEASDFAAAFVAANKTGGGSVYLTKHWKSHGDLSYRYQVGEKRDASGPYLEVKAYRRKYEQGSDDGWVEIWKGPTAKLDELANLVEA